ncbi:Hypothetical predicted protein [Cloeon dipterum]|uniref:Uncharacterized protein n=1 Tax=Cloeon dipterum TaxID=197152 RepID=A0A8S1DZJ6_9INSE|nr:Hypothetical predicted protein [Cloeon dipterum]
MISRLFVSESHHTSNLAVTRCTITINNYFPFQLSILMDFNENEEEAFQEPQDTGDALPEDESQDQEVDNAQISLEISTALAGVLRLSHDPKFQQHCYGLLGVRGASDAQFAMQGLLDKMMADIDEENDQKKSQNDSNVQQENLQK